ncbi:hypothetical protein AWJ20_827 [Sugiyamaella lignohabitans]|uniref:Rap-GAP domain-containing protein n=1 Tax=Sugiyamaella lignohabitans TaxID=796027 RepID=A0A167D7B0_9ASCO|nr:uncharacterized protein AWJ20_827 [Sugiyamaella lignohabitans]ANB12570.1 hypothetical protein AWJ20_827 [Sugiyamaella lignohabitans]
MTNCVEMSSSSSGLESVLKTLSKTFRGTGGSSPAAIKARIQPAVVEGAADLDQLLDKLNAPANVVSISDKIKAAELIRASIEENAVSSIPEIWYNARYLISSNHQTEARRAGLRLMHSCIAHDERSIGVRISYYKAIIKHSNLEDFDLQLDCLQTLTNNGRDLLDLNQSGYTLPRVLWSWLKRLASEAQEIRIGRKKDITLPWGTSMEQNFHDMMKYIINTLRFSIAAYDEGDLEIILKEATLIARKTSDVDDISLICELINTVMVYGLIPMNSLRNILEILCGISITVESLTDKVWECVLNLAHSHLGNSTISHLCQILENTHRKEVNSNTMRGAARFLQKLLSKQENSTEDDSGSVTKLKQPSLIPHIGPHIIPMTKVLHAYRKSLDVESLRHSLEICRCIYDLLKDEHTADCIGYELWESKSHSPLEIIYQISRTTSVEQKSRRSSAVSAGGGSMNNNTDTVSQILDSFVSVFHLLSDLLKSKRLKGPYEVVIDFFIDMCPYLDQDTALVVIDHFASMHYCNPMSTSWVENTETLLINFFFDPHWSSVIRVRILDIIKMIYILGNIDDRRSLVNDVIERVFSIMDEEYVDNDTIKALIELYLYICQDCNYSMFVQISEILMRQFNATKHMPKMAINVHHRTATHHHHQWPNATARSSKRQIIARAIAQLFVQVFRTLPRRSRYLYFNLVAICQKSITEPLAFIEAARVLIRIRSTGSNHIYLTDPANSQIAAGRVAKARSKSGSLSGPSLNNDDVSSISSSTTAAAIATPSDSSVNSSMVSSQEPVWLYPDHVEYLDGKLNSPSPILKRLLPGQEIDFQSSGKLTSREYEIDTTVLLDLVANVLEFGAHWEIYSFIWTHFPPQLANTQLFSGCNGEVLRLRKFLCDQISNSKLPPSVILPSDVTKHDIMVLQILTLSLLLPFNDVFGKTDYDYIVQALVLGLSSWERTAVPCIHVLVVCCYECPLSVKKFLGQIFAKFQTKITTTLSSPHILEFLISLSRLPWITDNFTQDEYKRVFAMAFTYIKHANDLTQKSQAEESDRIMSQYLLALAYSAISSWFLTIKLANRRHMATFITRNLILADGRTDDIDEQSLATLDLISRFSYSDIDLILQSSFTSNASDQETTTKSWIYGKSIISIETNIYTGASKAIVRRPTGTSLLNMRPDDKMVPKWVRDSITLKEASSSSEQNLSVMYSPSYYLLQLLVPNDIHTDHNPIPLNDDAQIIRAIGAIDRAPVVDFHKVGILYIAPDQRTEQEILANSTGSKSYRLFLSKMGKLVRLKGNRSIYTGGLDTEMDIDGEYAYSWSDKITQMIFHTTTMMPSPANPQDTSISSKKRHIGNNYISIFYDESGLPFRFDTIKSQFNFINIVVTPQSNGLDSILNSSEKRPDFAAKNFYQVRVYKRDGLPDLFAACNIKVVSEPCLAVFVRNLAIVASKFATVYHSGGQYVSNWRYRLQQINQLRERVATQQREEFEQKQKQQPQQNDDLATDSRDTGHTTGSVSTAGDVALSFLDQLQLGSGTPALEAVSDTNSSTPATSFVPDNDRGTDLPLLRSLDFSGYT